MDVLGDDDDDYAIDYGADALLLRHATVDVDNDLRRPRGARRQRLTSDARIHQLRLPHPADVSQHAAQS